MAGRKRKTSAAAKTSARPSGKPGRPGAAKAAKPRKAATKPSSRKTARPKLLSGGNPQIPKADGDAPVQAYIAAMPGWKREIGRRLDTLIGRAVPGVAKAVKWNSPFYGVADRGESHPGRGKVRGKRQAWFLSFHCFTHYVKVAFFQGAALHPLPPGASQQKDVRYLDIHADDALDEAQFASWVKQASALPGVRM